MRVVLLELLWNLLGEEEECAVDLGMEVLEGWICALVVVLVVDDGATVLFVAALSLFSRSSCIDCRKAARNRSIPSSRGTVVVDCDEREDDRGGNGVGCVLGFKEIGDGDCVLLKCTVSRASVGLNTGLC